MKIGSREIGFGHRPFIIAEMSGNHNRSIERAFAIVDAAAEAGADAIKLQTFTPDTMTLDVRRGEFRVDAGNALWAGRNLYDLYKDAYTPWEWHAQIMARAKERGLLCFSSPFDETAVDFLDGLGVPAFKIASFENNHIPLIRKAAATGKPLIISTGMASIAELDEAITAAHEAGCCQIVLLKCTSTYPATPENTNVLTIQHMRELFGCEVGLSDHTMGIGVAAAAVAHGATVVEKHFTLRRADGGVDSAFSLEPEELKSLVIETERAWQSLGRVFYGPTEAEKPSLAYRRSIYVAADIKAGDIFTQHNLRVVRPGRGLAPRFYDEIIGRKASRDARPGEPVGWDLIA